MFSKQQFSYSAALTVIVQVAGAASTGEHALPHGIFKRQLVDCPQTTNIVCTPKCKENEVCSVTVRTETTCPVARCLANGRPPSAKESNGGSGGAIAGGVIGGLLVLAIIGFFVWRNMKKKREAALYAAEKESGLSGSRAARASTHTVASMSSTTTRASNVIQIGYLPGVMNRSAPSTPGHGHFIPPVPPLPAGGEYGTPTIRYPQSPDAGTFFSADDILRASICTTNDPRASVATTIYRNNAVVSPAPANVVRLGKAAVVTVKAGSSTTSTPYLGSTPVVPSLDYNMGDKSLDGVPPSPAFYFGSAFNAGKSSGRGTPAELSGSETGSLAVPRRPVPGRTVTAEAVVVDSSAWEEEDTSDEEDDEKAIHRPRTNEPTRTRPAVDEAESPFSDRNSQASFSDMPLPAGTGLPPIMSSAARARRLSAARKDNQSITSASSDERGSRDSASTGSTERGKSPFDDANAVGRRR